MQKFLMIGLGGSGGAVLRSTYVDILRRLERSGWESGMPPVWQFRHIDVLNQPHDVRIPGDPRELDTGPIYCGLADFGVPYASYDKHHSSGPQSFVNRSVLGWRPDPRGAPVEPWSGAGQRRAYGSMIGLAKADRIADSISDAARAATQQNAAEILGQISDKLGDVNALVDGGQGQVIVVSSMAGGAGSGLYHLVIDVLRGLAVDPSTSWLQTITAFHIAPDTFGDPSNSLQMGNSAGYMAELLAGWESYGQHSPSEAPLLRKVGIQPPVARRTADYNFLVGPSNSRGTSLGPPGAVYKSLGRAISAMQINSDISTNFRNYILINWSGPADKLGLSKVSAANLSYPFKSIGFATIDTGMSAFEQYAVERLARGAYDVLRQPAPPSTAGTPEEALRRFVESERPAYFDACGLWEEDGVAAQHNQILDALQDRDQLKDSWTSNQSQDGVFGALTKVVSRPGKYKDGVERAQRFMNTYDECSRNFLEQARQQVQRAARDWVGQIQGRVLDATSNRLGMYGASPTIALIDSLDRQLEGASNELRRIVERSDVMLPKERDSLISELREMGGGSTWAGEAYTEVLALAKKPVLNSALVEAHIIASALIDDLRVNFLPQLRAALADGAEKVLNLSSAERAAVSGWPGTDGAVPERLRPAKNELHLLEHESYSLEYERLLCEVFATPGPEDAESRAIAEAIHGMWPNSSRPDQPLAETLTKRAASWEPLEAGLRTAMGLRARPFSASVDLGVDRILLRVRDWVQRREGALSSRLNISLPAFIDEGGSTAENDFVGKFADALRAASPMSVVDTAALQRLHGSATLTTKYLVPQLPFADSSNLGKQLQGVLIQEGFSPSDASALLNAPADAKNVEILGYFKECVHPLAFSTFNSVVAANWESTVGVAGSGDPWWGPFRSRSLEGSVPLEQNRLEAIVRGWFVAQFLNRIGNAATRGARQDSPLTIWAPGTSDGVLPFPAPLLGSSVNDSSSETLPGVLESYFLALLCLFRGSLAELGAYQALESLGELPREANSREHPLWHWILDGHVPAGAPEPRESVAGTSQASSSERLDALLATLRKQLDLRQHMRDEATTIDPKGDQERWKMRSYEIADLVVRSLGELDDALRRSQITAPVQLEDEPM